MHPVHGISSMHACVHAAHCCALTAGLRDAWPAARGCDVPRDHAACRAHRYGLTDRHGLYPASVAVRAISILSGLFRDPNGTATAMLHDRRGELTSSIDAASVAHSHSQPTSSIDAASAAHSHSQPLAGSARTTPGQQMSRMQPLRDVAGHKADWNLEAVVAFHLEREGLAPLVRGFTLAALNLVPGGTRQLWSQGVEVPGIDALVKYPIFHRNWQPACSAALVEACTGGAGEAQRQVYHTATKAACHASKLPELLPASWHVCEGHATSHARAAGWQTEGALPHTV